MSLESRVRPIDAAYVLGTDGRHKIDPLVMWVFGGTPPLTPDLVSRHFASRAAAFAALERRFADVPGQLDHGRWVADKVPVEDRITHHCSDDATWGDVLDDVGALAGHAVDPRCRAWVLDVFYGVRGAPEIEGDATVVVLRATHAILSGPTVYAIAANFFGGADEPTPYPGLGPITSRFRRVPAALIGLARAPLALARYARTVRAVVRARTTAGTTGPEPARVSPTILNRDPGIERNLRVLRLDPSLTKKSATVTTVILAAVARAVREYLEERGTGCPPELTAYVTLALTGVPESQGVNRITWGPVSLGTGDLTVRARVTAIARGLGQLRDDPDRLADELTVTNAAPSFLLPMLLRRQQANAEPYSHPRMHTVLSSVRIPGRPAWSLAGAPLEFLAAGAPPTVEATLTHGLVGSGTDLTLSVMSSPHIVPDPDRYVQVLQGALDEVLHLPERE